MSREHVLHSRPSPFSPTAPGGAPVPVLIQVPLVPALGRAPGRPAGRPAARPGARPRRRLRRELRMAGYVLLAALPVGLVALGVWGGRTAALGSSPPAAALAPADLARAHRPPSVSITIEPAGFAPYVEPAPPVVLPGYLLPDDGPEEPAHAGS